MKEMSRCEQNLVSSILIFAGTAPYLIAAQSCLKVAEVRPLSTRPSAAMMLVNQL